MTGPSPEVINWDTVYQSFLEEKRLWNKDNGRMYNHNIISFHKNEKIAPEQALEFGKEFADKWFPNHQTIISVHQDRDHIHIHLVTNTVSYIDGLKLHNSRADLQRMKGFTNKMCQERGLTIAEKGRHFDGTAIEQGETIAWSKDKYHLLTDDSKKSFVVDCAIAVMEAKETSCCREDFIRDMGKRGWHTTWSDNKKHITFQNDNDDKVRDTNLSKSFSMDISKEVLLNEFERQNEIRLAKLRTERDRADAEREGAEEFAKYYAEVESAITRTRADTETVRRNKTARTITGSSSVGDTDAFIENIKASNNDVRAAEYESCSAEQQRQVEDRQRADATERAARYDGPTR